MVGCDELGETENGVLSPGFRSELPRDSAQREPASFFRLESVMIFSFKLKLGTLTSIDI